MPGMSSAAAALHSDHVNLLIFRYLQEVGFESAAIAFHRDWHRPAGCHDPEDLPFATDVQRNELVSIIQTGLYHDDLQARIRKGERRFRWTGIDARESVERRDLTVDNGSALPSHLLNKRKENPPTMRAPDEFPTPAPKRQRRSEGSEVHINGERDAMDIDAVSPSAEADEDGHATSPAMQSEPEQAEVMERYDSMDVATQTEIKTSPKTSTMYWKVDKPGASIMHSIWNPDSNPKNAKTLLIVGESLCRFYQVPDGMTDAKQVSHLDDPSLPDGSTVTASTWRPDGLGVSCAVAGVQLLPNKSGMDQQLLLELNRQGGSEAFQLGPPLLDPAGIVLSLCYSPDLQFLLAARMNNSRGLVQIWKAPRPGIDVPKKPLEPIAWHIFENPVLDVAWTGDDTFLVCGSGGLSAMYQVDLSQQREVGVIAAGTVTIRGLISRNSNILAMSSTWDKLRFDHRHRIAVFSASDERKLVVTPRLHDNTDKVEEDVQVDVPGTIQALAFNPWQKPTDETEMATDFETPSLLAAALTDGTCIIYSISRSEVGAKCTETASLSLLDGPALALAWSPTGDHLAIGNAELVQIWTADSLKRKNGVLLTTQASVIWRPASESNGITSEGHGQPQSLSEPSLSWSSDGESLAFAADKQIAVIRFRPSLNGECRDTELNGRPSP